ncbi:GHKL domain-containing protein [bacterium]|nr:GHKL domain-containing protein [bacterium]
MPDSHHGNKTNSPADAHQALMALDAYARIGLLAGGLGHNLQSPLTAIKGYTQMMQVDHGDIEELGLILKEIQVIQCITFNLMAKCRHLTDRKPKPVLLNDLIHTELEFLKSHLEFKHKIKSQVAYDTELPVIYGIYADFSQIVLHLLLNGIEAMYESEHKDLFIETQHDEAHVFIRIRDTGCGIPEDIMQEVCNPLFSTKIPLDESRNDKIPAGSGMGLYIVQVLAGQYHGSLNLQSSDQGTTATVSLPYEPD